jgi:feruloyl esterase
MFDWLEKGIKPSSSTIIAAQRSAAQRSAAQRTVAAGATAASRPLCKYPQTPRVGGDASLASCFVCTSP